MKILVCMKQVPQKDAPLNFNDSGTWIREDVSYEVNEPDAFALEEALRQKEKHGGEVMVITAAPRGRSRFCAKRWPKARTEPSIWKTTHSSAWTLPTPPGPLPRRSKKINSTSSSPACNLTTTATPRPAWFWADFWAGRTQPSSCRSKKRTPESRSSADFEAGFFQFVNMPLPAVLTIQSGINKLRYATLIGIKQAKNKPLRKVALAEVQSAISANMQKIERLYIPQKTKNTEFLEGPPGEVAKKLAEKLRNEVRVL